jgi:phage shock protein A
MGEIDATLGRVKQHRERLETAATGLETAITRPAGDAEAWAAGVRAATAEVDAALRAHVDEVEAPGGLHDEIIDRSPRLTHTVEVLRREHVSMADQVARVDAALADPEPSVETVREQALALLAQISRHRHRGADLLWDSFDYDIGAGD